jgi:hypothetical protein
MVLEQPSPRMRGVNPPVRGHLLLLQRRWKDRAGAKTPALVLYYTTMTPT